MKSYLSCAVLPSDQTFNWYMVRNKDGVFGHICISSLAGKRYVIEITRPSKKYIARFFVSNSNEDLDPTLCNCIGTCETDTLDAAKEFSESLLKTLSPENND